MFPFKNFFHFFYKPFSQSHHFMWGRWWESLLIFQKSLILLVRRIISVINWTATNDAKLPGRFLSFGILELASWASSVKKKKKKKRIHIWFAQKVDFLRLMDIILIPINIQNAHIIPLGLKGRPRSSKFLFRKGIVIVLPIGFFCVLLSMMGKKHENSYFQGYIGEIWSIYLLSYLVYVSKNRYVTECSHCINRSITSCKAILLARCNRFFSTFSILKEEC